MGGAPPVLICALAVGCTLAVGCPAGGAHLEFSAEWPEPMEVVVDVEGDDLECGVYWTGTTRVKFEARDEEGREVTFAFWPAEDWAGARYAVSVAGAEVDYSFGSTFEPREERVCDLEFGTYRPVGSADCAGQPARVEQPGTFQPEVSMTEADWTVDWRCRGWSVDPLPPPWYRPEY